MINKRSKKARTKIKKPKYLSLRHQLSSEKTKKKHSLEMLTSSTNHRQLNLFPLHPEGTTAEDRDTHDENMAYFFSTADGGATTLSALLGSSTTSSSDDVSLSYGGFVPADGGGELVRTALRNKERDASEEKWVCYSEVVERRSDEEVTSCAVDDDQRRKKKIQSLALKLDYQEILNAWSDRGPLYIHADSPQTVPDIFYDDFVVPYDNQTLPNGLRDGWRGNEGLWSVPKMEKNDSRSGSGNEEEGRVSEEIKLAQREASVLRYKEKRQNRLFAKRIRYEVRKLNAEKRPRVKGRFVKRS